ncbi:MAG: glycoside hydrolase family 3 N-terminal domain-containing protein [Actinocrinis sp.]
MAAVPPYRDRALPIPERIDDLLARMTLPEKIGQMLHLDAREGVSGLINDMHAGAILHASAQSIGEAMDLAARTRLGIPVLVGEDCIHGYSFWPGATIFPTQLAMAASWDADLVERVARATAVEVSTTGVHWTFSPVLCIARDLRWGRVGETFGEDPHLIGELGSAMVHGYQGDGLADPSAILACAKHFAGYSETQGGRDASEADLSRRKLRSWFLPPFERVAREGCRTFMIGYQSIDGVPITANRWLLREVLREEWKYSGTLVTDWDNVGRMVWEQQVCADDAEAASRAVRAGNDLILTTPQFFEGAQEAIRRGTLSEPEVDAAVRRILALKFELGLFEDPRRPDPERQRTYIHAPQHAEVNLEIARRGLVLLTNDGTLPLSTHSGSGPGSAPDSASASTPALAPAPRTIALIGPNADDQHAQLGDWAGASGQVDWLPDGHPRHLTETVLDGMRALIPDTWTVTHAAGAHIAQFAPNPRGPVLPDGQPAPDVVIPAAADPDLLAEAVEATADADLIVAVVGDTIGLIGESRSTATLDLVGGQAALLEALADTGIPMVVVVISSKPLILPGKALNAAAIIQAFNPGMRGGRAIAELILGRIDPSGRLPISIPRHVGQQPIYYNQLRGQHGRRYADLTQDPQFPFGHGMSYSTVRYEDLRVENRDVGPADTIAATVTVTNTGGRPVRETVQVYIRDLVTSATWADKELKAYRQIDLRPGESRRVDLDLPASACTIVTADGRREVEPGEFDLLVGPSSSNDKLLASRFTIR